MQVLRKQRSKHVFLAFILIFVQARSQTSLNFDHYGIAEGLSESSVNTVIADLRGTVWAGTQEGLNEFDGFEFRAVTKEGHPEIKSTFILASDRDASGNLWFGTKRELLYYQVSKRKITSYSNPKNDFSIRQVLCTHQGVFVLQGDQRLYLFNPKSKIFKPISLQFKVKQILKGSLGIYAISKDHQLFRITNDAKAVLFYNSNGSSIFSAFPVKGRFLLFLNGKTLLIDEKYPHHQQPFDLWDSKFNSLVSGVVPFRKGYAIGTNGHGLFVLENNSAQHYLVDYLHPKGLKSKHITALYLDQHDVIWIGSDKGLSCFSAKQSPWTYVGPSLNLRSGLPSENVWSFLQTNNRLWIGTNTGLSSLDKATNNFTHYPLDPRFLVDHDGSVMAITPLPKDRYLIVCFDGLFYFDPRTGKYNPIVFKQPRIKARHLHFYHTLVLGDKVLVSTSSGILSMNTATLLAEEVYFEANNAFRFLYQDNKANLWCLSDQQGFCALDKLTLQPKALTITKKLKSLTADALSCLVEVEHKVFLLGTYGSGILKVNLETEQVTVMNKSWGLTNPIILGMVRENNGQLWVSTNSGLASFSKKESKFVTLSPFGMDHIEYNANALYSNCEGQIFLGGPFGYLVYDKKLENEDNTMFFPKIYEVLLKGKNDEWPSGSVSMDALINRAYALTLPYHSRDFEIWFEPNELYQASMIEYKCEIIGETTDTVFLGKTNHVAFNALAAGTYYLRIYSRKGRFGKWTETPALLTVIIQPPFWASKPFVGTCFALLLLGSYLYVRIQIRKERKEKERLEQLVVERTQEIAQQKDEIQEKNVRITEEKNKVLEQQEMLFIEKAKAEKWLNNALPSQAVKELQRLGKVRSKSFESATILFTDVVGFSKISEAMTPARLVNKLDSLVKKFDAIIKESNIEKIKTIGDAYMAVGGIPERNSTHPLDVCFAALKIKDYMLKQKYEALANGKDYWEIRIGINTGPVTAGIIGNLKIAYDVWGAAVNQAQRMEQSSDPGTISVAESTFLLVEPYFEFKHRGKASMKTKTLVNRYELVKIKPDLSENGEGIVPNDLFFEIAQLHLYSPIKYYSVETEVMNMLEDQLPKEYYYHCAAHTKEVIEAVEHLALCEGVRDEDLFLLKTAALFHDLGFTKQYEHNESIGVEFARQILPKFGYNELHINTVVELIFATEVPHKPVNQLQEIMCDADLNYLGTDHFETISQELKKELMFMGKLSSDKEWDAMQIPFLQQHRYFTQTAINSWEEKKRINLAKVIARYEQDDYL
ncbi:MAG: HD domain-containing protein [Flavobacteriia bacterium]|nr:HD domain-containing protein [Flavobacteriia bacterium]